MAFAGCGGGGGGTAAPAYDLTGHWQLFLTPTGAPETGPLPIYLSQSGSSIDGVALTGSMNGASFSITANAGTFTIAINGSATSASSAVGSVVISGAIAGNGTFRLARFTPTGTMSASGSLDGIPIDATSAAATAVRNYADVGLTTLTSVALVLTDELVDVQIELDASGLAVGALAVPSTVGVEVLFRNDAAIVSATVASGTVTVTSYDSAGIAGSYTLTTSVGTLTGAFDLAFDVDSYDP